MTTYARGFRLHLKGGRVLNGAEFPGGQVVVMDDPEWGLTTGARSADLLTSGYPDSRIEWADQASGDQSSDLTERPEDAARKFARRLAAVEQLCSGHAGYHTITVKTLLTAMSDADDNQAEETALPPAQCAQHPHAPVIGGLCGGCSQYGVPLPGTPTIADWTGEQQGPAVSGGDVTDEVTG
ncbi:hypothetical protein [[Kitasatospora] papulosa]|uniref:hypothetical protein n=1 Tax=[Kitasatospora] papulosa TaxID=1464011 RepID=UPI0036D06975